ncbi:hypothetical protein PENTCL1PPCAC_8848, partial [Pristionchus entomophagus]
IACTEDHCYCRDQTQHFHVKIPDQPHTYGAIIACMDGTNWRLVSLNPGGGGNTAIAPEYLAGACQAVQPTSFPSCMRQMPVVYKGMRNGDVLFE